VERELILNRLLDKYENSKHLSQPKTSKRRVMLRIGKNDLPEYTYENAEIRDRFNNAAKLLEREGIIEVEFLFDRAIISTIVLNLDNIDLAYKSAGRAHPARTAEEYCEVIKSALSNVKTAWIRDWQNDICRELETTKRLPSFCRQGMSYAKEFLGLIAYYDDLGGSTITTRALSSACFSNSKRFEQEFQDEFLRIAMQYHPEMAEQSGHTEFGVREKLELLGIWSGPELYQLSGHCIITTRSGALDLSPMYPYGLAVPGTVVDEIISFDLNKIQKVILIENLTSYNEYLRLEIKPDELVIYHGGFLSPKKQSLLQKIAESISSGIKIYFWADIDLGGFLMFECLRKIFPQLSPMRMSMEDVCKFSGFGLPRDSVYLNRLETALAKREFPFFEDAIKTILKYGVTIEQEVFLLD